MLRLACLLLVLSDAPDAAHATRPSPSAASAVALAPPAGASAIVKGQLHVDGTPFFPVGMCQLRSRHCAISI